MCLRLELAGSGEMNYANQFDIVAQFRASKNLKMNVAQCCHRRSIVTWSVYTLEMMMAQWEMLI